MIFLCLSVVFVCLFGWGFFVVFAHVNIVGFFVCFVVVFAHVNIVHNTTVKCNPFNSIT